MCGGVARESRGTVVPGCLPKRCAKIRLRKRDDCFIEKNEKNCDNTT